jgi:hypothetical protein
MYEEERRREGRDRVGRRRRCERPEDGCKGYECEENEQGRLDRVRTWAPNRYQTKVVTQFKATYDDRKERSLPHHSRSIPWLPR